MHLNTKYPVKHSQVIKDGFKNTGGSESDGSDGTDSDLDSDDESGRENKGKGGKGKKKSAAIKQRRKSLVERQSKVNNGSSFSRLQENVSSNPQKAMLARRNSTRQQFRAG